MNPATYAEAEELVRAISVFSRRARGVRMVLCPPFVWLTDLSHKHFKSVFWGAQDVFWEPRGAFTGEISPAMLKNSRVTYVILGHSERRRWFKESDEMVNKKVIASQSLGLRVILCVGEPMGVRRRGLGAAKRFVKKQLEHDLKSISRSMIHASGFVVAYEPVWAIGTGKADHPEDTIKMANFIKQTISSMFPVSKSKIYVLYGGSVTSKNAADFLGHKEIDGALVGGASLKAKEFGRIITIAAYASR